ncbi:hypothetical protein O181_072361 [Austropuccinia psidii MF-1]|uniref:Uncharacterized protein n=1 Tax=Austropuccinia psidii MF-1 TaxID=1389203 RepID=A0A9Q3I7C6_9BASI|nr:hypothetical protein [Austropuccinia psidii MF-1]
MDWSGDASLEPEISTGPHSCPFMVHLPPLFTWTGLMHMESQPSWILSQSPPSERLKPENFYVAGIIPGRKEPTALQLNYLLMRLIKELKELWQGDHFSPTSTGPLELFICAAILTAIADVVSMRKLTGFISHSGNHFCNFCTIYKAQIEEIGPQFHYTHSYQNHKSDQPL